MKYIIPEDRSLGDSAMCLFGDMEATKKIICAAMEYIEENNLVMPTYSFFAGHMLVADIDKENTIDIQRKALEKAGYTGFGGVMGTGPIDGPSREVFIMSMAKIKAYGWDVWLSSLISKDEQKIKDDEAMEDAIRKYKEWNEKKGIKTDLKNIDNIANKINFPN